MKNYEIDFDKLTQKEAEQILNMINDSFDVWAKCDTTEGVHQVVYLEIRGNYTEEIKDK